jgi:hypothetical protein
MLALTHAIVLPSASQTASALRSKLSRLNGWPIRSPADASRPASRPKHARLGADVVRYAFIAVDLHHLLLAGLPAHLTPITLGLLDCTLRLRHDLPDFLRSEFMVEDIRGAPDAGPEPMHRPLAALIASALTFASGIAAAQTAPPSAQQQRDRGTLLTFTCVLADEHASPLDVTIEPVRQIVFYGHTLARYREDGAKVVWSAIAVNGDHTGSLDLTSLEATIDDETLRCRPKARKF